MPNCRDAESRILSSLPASASVRVEDTEIAGPNGETVTVHSIELPGDGLAATQPPLVLLPGYGTGSAIWTAAWRCWLDGGHPLGRRRVVALDPLGWYLSAHPRWTAGLEPTAAEAWFVDSIEAWRAKRGIESMDLLGHSIGGYLAACYAEGHPSRISRLVLLSPAGVPKEPPDYRDKLPGAPWRMRLLLRLWGRGYTPHYALRCLPSSRGYRIASWTAKRWTSRVPDAIDASALADYIYHGWSEGPASSEEVLGAILHPGAWAKRPLCERIPGLRVKRVDCIYGDRDWMDLRHMNAVAERCLQAEKNSAPAVWVQLVDDSGHYPHLDNVRGFTAALQRALGRPDDDAEPRAAGVPPGFAERWSGPAVPQWRSWEGYDFGR